MLLRVSVLLHCYSFLSLYRMLANIHVDPMCTWPMYSNDRRVPDAEQLSPSMLYAILSCPYVLIYRNVFADETE